MKADSSFDVVRSWLFGAAVLGALGSTGCVPIGNQGYPIGAIYTGTQVPAVMDRAETAGDNKPGSKVGRACATGILGLAAFGDASLDAAKKAGGITSVHSVEYEATAVLGFLYVNACTVVHGG